MKFKLSDDEEDSHYQNKHKQTQQEYQWSIKTASTIAELKWRCLTEK